MPRRPVALEDLLRYRLVGEAQISPDGRRVVFTAKRTDPEKNKYYTSLWLADVESGTARPFTGDGHGDGSPRWSPDGTQIAFTSDRDKPKSQVWLIPADGGEARAVTKLEEGGVRDPAWSPDGTRIAFLYRPTPEQWREKAKKEREEKGLSTPPRIHKRLFYRLDGFGYFDECFWHVWVVDVKTGQTKQLTDGAFSDGPPVWSPDSRTIAFAADRRENADVEGRSLDVIWTVPAEGGELSRVDAPDGPKGALAWSPDGRWLAYAGHDDPDDDWGGKNFRVMVVPAGKKRPERASTAPIPGATPLGAPVTVRPAAQGASEARDLTGASDLMVGYATLADMHEAGAGPGIVWSPDSRTLYFPISAFGDTRLYRVGVSGQGLQPLTPPKRELGAFSLSADGQTLAVTLASATEPHDVYVMAADGSGLRRVSEVNHETTDEVELRMPESIEVKSADGTTVHGWVLKPAGFDAAQKYPCVLYVHGGPAAQYGGESTPFHELQWLAANGYVVLFSNPRGSRGYGEAHTTAIRGDWGNKDWQDVQAVADYGAALPYVDAARMAIMGGSYGGYMTAWAVGHTNRFACAITDRLVGNIHSFSGTVDFPFEHNKAWKGNAWDDPSDMWRCSPLAYAGKIETPLLIVHSDGDLRCPVEQAEQLFAALRHRGKEVEMVRYPAETSHGLSRGGPPDLRLDRLRRNLAWLDAHLKPAR